MDQDVIWYELGLGPGDFVLDGDPTPPPQKGGGARQFSARLLWPNGWMDEACTWHGGLEVGLSSGDFVRWGVLSIVVVADWQH